MSAPGKQLGGCAFPLLDAVHVECQPGDVDGYIGGLVGEVYGYQQGSVAVMAKECVVAMGGEMRVFEIDIHHVEEVSFAYGGF